MVIKYHRKTDLDENILNNYRPISLLPSISKIFERIVYNQLYSYFIDNNLLYTSQYGFRVNHSTEFAILELINRIHEYLDSNLNPISIFMDLSKAFDTIDHQILLNKLEKYGIADIELKWFTTYLHNRSQYVQYNNLSSKISTITTGVPQGSILGPLLFIIYINDLFSITDMNTLHYADDTCILFPLTFNHVTDATRLTQTINEKLDLIYKWLSSNKLSLNIEKTKCMIFQYKQQHLNKEIIPNIKFNGISLKYVNEFNFLGVTIDNTLSWSNHINITANKISKVNGILSKLKTVFPTNILLMIYNSLILSRINYGILTWGFGDVYRIKLLQKKALRSISKRNYYSHTKPICKSLKVLLFDDIFTLATLKFFYKFNNNFLPKYFYNTNFLKKYQPNRPNLRQIRPPDYSCFVIDDVNYRPNYLIPKSKKASSQKRLAHYLPSLLNSTKIAKSVTSKVNTHSLNGFSLYFKKLTINNYDVLCDIPNCFSCRNS